MTLTTPSCPSAQELPEQARQAVQAVAGVRESRVEVVWDPPWDPSRMSEDARLAMNMF
jgi:metal-sulfur cluster biosynthetic enzyme